MRDMSNSKAPWKKEMERDTERVYAPALKLSMLPLSIQEQDIWNFFRKVHPFKVVENGPYWIVVFGREKDRRHILRKLFRDPYEVCIMFIYLSGTHHNDRMLEFQDFGFTLISTNIFCPRMRRKRIENFIKNKLETSSI